MPSLHICAAGRGWGPYLVVLRSYNAFVPQPFKCGNHMQLHWQIEYCKMEARPWRHVSPQSNSIVGWTWHMAHAETQQDMHYLAVSFLTWTTSTLSTIIVTLIALDIVQMQGA